MADDPFYIKILDKLGFNTTKLKWRLYRMQQNAERARKQGVTPPWLQWLRYEHKICGHCGAVNDREARQCHRCARRLPGMLGYRVQRIGGLIFPAGSPVVSTVFLVVIVAVYGLSLALDGLSALLSPSQHVMYLFGAYSNRVTGGLDWWRWLGFSFTHAGIIHIGFNSFALTQIGPLVEGQLGRRRMLVLITACQMSAAMATYFWYASIQGAGFFTIGASGWVFGLIGFGSAYFHRMGDAGRAYRDVLVRWLIYALLFGIIIRANNAAHIGGMLGGAALAYLPEVRGRDEVQRSEMAWGMGFWVCVLLWVSAFVMMGQFAVTNLDLLQDR